MMEGGEVEAKEERDEGKNGRMKLIKKRSEGERRREKNDDW